MTSWRFFLIVFSYSWIIWSLAIFNGTPIDDFPTGILFILGGLGPTVGWIICNMLDGKKVIGNSVAMSQFDYLAEPGKHLFIATAENKVFLELKFR